MYTFQINGDLPVSLKLFNQNSEVSIFVFNFCVGEPEYEHN